MSERIWIIDDDPYITEILENCLWREGYETTVFHSLSKIDLPTLQGSADLLLCDRMLPEMDGADFIRQIRDSGINTPVIIMSIKNEPHEVVEGFERGADDYLAKPFSLKELTMRIRAILTRKKQIA